ncbi:MAG TPA: MASE1 domain-containing protein [Pyrinomonadaceae bacterium]|nr:MASE1 domain-containing protein [Pyrinomonadaceae bacterium]
MKRSPSRQVLKVAVVATVYFAAARLGLSLAVVHSNVTAVWPPTGIAIAALLIWGRGVWPGILIGALAANLLTQITFSSAIGIGIGNTLEALAVLFLLTRSKRWNGQLDSGVNVFWFAFCAAVVGPLVSATVGTLSLVLGGSVSGNDFAAIWFTWWMGDGFGALLFGPLLLTWANKGEFDRREQVDALLLLSLLVAVSLMIFGGWFPGSVKTYPLAYLCLPLLLWSALNFDQRVVTTSIVLMTGIAIWGTRNGYGSFVQPNPNVSLLLLLSFLGTGTLMTLVLSAVINERRRIESEKHQLGNQLELHRRRVQDIVDHVPGVVWEAWGQPDQANQRIDFVSSHVEQMLGYSQDEWLSTPNFWLSIVHPDDRERAAKEAGAIYASGKGGRSRFRWLHKDGREIWVEAQSIVVSDQTGPIGMRGVTMDITAAVSAEVERAELLKRESEARGRAEEASRLKDEFLATVSHELRTPLNAVVGWSRLLRSGQLDQDGAVHAVEVIERNAEAQKQIIEDLLDVSRIITGKLRVDTQPVDLLLVIHDAIDAIRPAVEAKEIQVRTRFDSPDLVVKGDVDRLQQVFWNLLSNAVKFTPSQGTIEVLLIRSEANAEIRIEDSGPGIPEDFIPRIFDRFSQADGSSTRKHGGLGLGLAIVRHLVELHGGTVYASNGPSGRGAVLTVRLPAIESVSENVLATAFSQPNH